MANTYKDMAKAETEARVAAERMGESQTLAVDAVEKANQRITDMQLSMQVPITLTYDAWAEWTKFQQAIAAAANMSPITAPAFLIAPGGGMSGADQVAAANAIAAQMAANARRNGGQPSNVR